MIRFCEIFNLYLNIYYSTAEWSDDDNESDGQMGKKVDSNEVKCLKESVKHKD